MEKVLFLALDAIPLDTAASVMGGGAGPFSGFCPPAALVSSFPSSTNVAMPGILRPLAASPSPGYEARFYDRGRDRLRGGGLWSYYGLRFPWRRLMDWQTPEPLGSVAGLAGATRLVLRRLRAVLERFVNSERPSFFAYVGATDLDAHYRPQNLASVLLEVGAILADLRARRPFSTILFSDHGISGGLPLTNTWPGVNRALKAAGFRPRGRLSGARDVVLSPWGLVSNFEVFTRPGEELEVAALLAGVDGVDLCALQAGRQIWRVVSEGGSAQFARSGAAPTDRWVYRPLDGDPLGFAAVEERIRDRAAESADGFADEYWFAESLDSEYPDALYRLAAAFSLVANPASVVCSLEPGAMFGSRRTERLGRSVCGPLEWTHGALRREPTFGFLTSDRRGWVAPRAVRFDHALLPFVRS